MLPAANRLTSAAGFDAAVRGGRRAGSRTLVVHVGADAMTGAPPLVGFVVSRAVGNAVTRNRVKRRLRHLVRGRLPGLAPAVLLVVRALPAAARASYADLERDLDRCLGSLSAVAGR